MIAFFYSTVNEKVNERELILSIVFEYLSELFGDKTFLNP